MRKHARALLPAAAAAILVVVPAAHAKPAATTVKVVAGKPSEFKFSLSAKSVKHGAITFTITNAGAVPHDFKLCSKPTKTTADSCKGKAAPQISPGGKTTLKVKVAKAGTYEYLCTVPGHATAGMKGLLKVT